MIMFLIWVNAHRLKCPRFDDEKTNILQRWRNDKTCKWINEYSEDRHDYRNWQGLVKKSISQPSASQPSQSASQPASQSND
jgi:hypothetical protein